MNKHRFLLAVSAAALLSASSSAQSYTELPADIWGLADITPDGEIVIGRGVNGNFFWRWKVDAQPTYIGGDEVSAVSDDGSVIAGTMKNPANNKNTAARWTAATGWVLIGDLGSTCDAFATSAWDISGDGTKIVGLGWNNCSGQGFLWEEGAQPLEMQPLEHMWNGQNRASTISRDGSTIAGFAQGNFSRTPAYWSADTQLGVVPDPDDVGEYFGVSPDGSVLLGGRNGHAFFQEKDPITGLYVETDIGNLNPGWSGRATDMSDSGGTILGYDVLQGGTEAWVWNPQSGIVGLQTRLLSLGVPGVPFLGAASAMSADGQIVIGNTFFGPSWIVEMPPGPIAKPYSCGLQNPPESLVQLSGSTSIGNTIQLGVDDPTGSMVAPCIGVVAFSTAPDPSFPCGTPIPGWGMFSPSADLLISVAGGNPFLTLVSPTTWTTATQPVPVDFFTPLDTNLFGFELYAQGVLFSTSSLQLGLTNGMRLTIGLD